MLIIVYWSTNYRPTYRNTNSLNVIKKYKKLRKYIQKITLNVVNIK